MKILWGLCLIFTKETKKISEKLIMVNKQIFKDINLFN